MRSSWGWVVFTKSQSCTRCICAQPSSQDFPHSTSGRAETLKWLPQDKACLAANHHFPHRSGHTGLVTSKGNCQPVQPIVANGSLGHTFQGSDFSKPSPRTPLPQNPACEEEGTPSLSASVNMWSSFPDVFQIRTCENLQLCVSPARRARCQVIRGM